MEVDDAPMEEVDDVGLSNPIPSPHRLFGRAKRAKQDPLAHLFIPFDEIKTATLDFDEKYKHGFGLSGDTFNAVFKNKGGDDDGGSFFAVVKRLSRVHSSVFYDWHISHADFEKQLKAILELNHDNVIKLLGYSYEFSRHALKEEEETRYLVYEFAPNYSLYDALIGTGKRLDWKTRLNIALDVAKGLEYLHGKNLALGDVNSSRVLLFENYKAKVAEFNLLYRDSTLNIREDVFLEKRGRFDSQCYDHLTGPKCHSFIKSDVYSFGIILLELLTGKDVRSETFVTSVFPKLIKSKLQSILDPGISNEEAADWLADLAALCIFTYHEFRPKISFVVELLEAMCDQYSTSNDNTTARRNPNSIMGEKESVVLEVIKKALEDESDWCHIDKKQEINQNINMKLRQFGGSCD